MSRYFTTACIVALVATTPALADWEFTKWGMTPAQIIAGSSGMIKPLPQEEIKRDDADHWETSLRGDVRIKGAVRPASFMFDTRTGGLRCVIYDGLGSDAVTVKQELVGKYGPGKADTFGNMESIDWVTPDEIGLMYNETGRSAAVIQCRPGG